MSKKIKEHDITITTNKYKPQQHLSCNVCGLEGEILHELVVTSGKVGTCIRMCDDCVNKLWVAVDQANQRINKNF
ncbi:MAG: hypothetical protein ACRCXT_13080 [Paraclostridium sp.]